MDNEVRKIAAFMAGTRGWPAEDAIEMEGATILSVHVCEKTDVFFTTDRGVFHFYHAQDCCEMVELVSLLGVTEGTSGAMVLIAEERENHDQGRYESETWTFYTIRTNRGDIDMRWLGSSNGYYSESVDVRVLSAIPSDLTTVEVKGDIE